MDVQDEDGQTALEMAEAGGCSKSVAVPRGEEAPPETKADLARCELVALQFAQKLVSGDFEAAVQMLAPTLRKQTSADQLKASYEEIVLPDDEPPEDVEVLQSDDDSPDKRRGDLGWAYVSISGSGYLEDIDSFLENVSALGERDDVRIIYWFDA